MTDESDSDVIAETLDASVDEVADSAESSESEEMAAAIDHIPDEVCRTEQIVIVEPSQWRTTDVLSRFEMTRLISIRAAEIEANPSVCMIEYSGDDPINIAKQELAARKCPLVIRRVVGDNHTKVDGADCTIVYVECRNPNTMIHAMLY
jgi:DNA-directed RNA polymerase subunit K/omega